MRIERNRAGAIADFDSALRLEPNNIIALTGRAQAYELAGDDAKALADYDAILGPVGSQPNYALGGDRLGKYRAQRAFLLVRMKRFDDADAYFAAMLAILLVLTPALYLALAELVV